MSSINSQTLITVNNATGASIPVAAGTRLILSSDPVTAYADSSGIAPVSGGNSIDVDPASPPTVWISRPVFDYTAIAMVAVDAVSTPSPLNGNGPTMSWWHTAAGTNRLVIVAVSWQESTGDESIDSVTYDGVPMSLVSSSDFGAVYSLMNPPTGQKNVVISWSGSSSKGAVAASISFSRVTLQQTIAFVASATGSSTTATLSVPTKSNRGQIFGVLSIQAMGSAVTLTPGTGLTPRWNATAGSAGAATLTQGAGVTRASTGLTEAISWTLSASRSWSVIGIVVEPQAAVTLGIPGGVTVGAHFVDARNYASLQAAADDVAVGGTLMIPNGDYSVPSGGLIVRKQMTIRGETGTTLYPYSATANQPVIKIFPDAKWLLRVMLRDLTIRNATTPSSPISGNYGILCDVPSDGGSKIGNLALERVFVQSMGDDGIHLSAYGTLDSYFVFVALRDCKSSGNRGRGMYVSYANQLYSHGSHFADNDLDGFYGLWCELEFEASRFESNCRTSDSGRISATLNGQLTLKLCPLSVVSGCRFEKFTSAQQPVTKRGIVLDQSTCATIKSNVLVGDATEASDLSQRGIYITAGSGGAVTACCVLPNRFSNVKTAIEVNADPSHVAQDCIVMAQQIDSGTGEMKLPVGVGDSGIVVLGSRNSGSGGLNRGMLLPPRGASLPALTQGGEQGYALSEIASDGTSLRIWDGHTWRRVNIT